MPASHVATQRMSDLGRQVDAKTEVHPTASEAKMMARA
jgi:hypothetical protein